MSLEGYTTTTIPDETSERLTQPMIQTTETMSEVVRYAVDSTLLKTNAGGGYIINLKRRLILSHRLTRWPC
jgi:hypothetical protein